MKIINYLKWILFGFINLISCKKIDNDMFYIIKKGEHYSNERPLIKFNDNRIDFEFYVDSTWLYSSENDVGWSKLIGLSNGISPHGNSARVGWRCRKNNEIHVSAYYYLNKIRYVEELGQLEVGKWYNGSVYYKDKNFIIEVNGVISSKDKYRDINNTWLCHPYFGGNLTAPHDMKFYFNFF